MFSNHQINAGSQAGNGIVLGGKSFRQTRNCCCARIYSVRSAVTLRAGCGRILCLDLYVTIAPEWTKR